MFFLVLVAPVLWLWSTTYRKYDEALIPATSDYGTAVHDLRFQELPSRDFFSSGSDAHVERQFDPSSIRSFAAEPASDASFQLAETRLGDPYNENSLLGADLNVRMLSNLENVDLAKNGMRAYFGLLHAHTGDSDGRGHPRDAMRIARDVAKLHFFAITDHPEFWFYKGGEEVWRRQHAIAAEEARKNFVPFIGFEYSSTVWGHFVVLNTENYRSSNGDFSLRPFFDWLAAPAQANALVIFAHPGFHAYRKPFEYEHFIFDPRLRDRMIGIETIHLNEYTRLLRGYSGEFAYIDEAIGRGWFVGSFAAEDNHYPNWGLRDDVRLGLVMPELSAKSILAALRARRFFATTNNNLQFFFALQSGSTMLPMGSIVPLDEVAGKPVEGIVRFLDPNSFGSADWLEVLVNGRIAKKVSLPALEPELTADAKGGDVKLRRVRAGEFRFAMDVAANSRETLTVYVRLHQGQAGRLFTQSSPVFIVPKR